MKRFLTLALAVLVVGCGSTRAPDPCGDPIKVPAPYWDPPTVSQEARLSPPPSLLVATYRCPPDATPERCTELAIEAMVSDNLALLADSEECRFKFDGLLTLIEFVPPVTPPPPLVVTPSPP